VSCADRSEKSGGVVAVERGVVLHTVSGGVRRRGVATHISHARSNHVLFFLFLHCPERLAYHHGCN